MILDAQTFFTFVFFVFLSSYTLLKLWINRRQIHHLYRHRDYIPVEFHGLASTTYHTQFTDYTIKKIKIQNIQILLEALFLLGMTWGSGFNKLIHYWQACYPPDQAAYKFGLALFLSTFLISYCVNSIFSLILYMPLEKHIKAIWLEKSRQFMKEISLGLILGIPFILILLWIMQHITAWWFALWIFFNSFILFIMFIFPIWIDPFFVQTRPLTDLDFQQECLQFMQQCGFSIQSIFVTAPNTSLSDRGLAYFTGVGQSKQIVLHEQLFSRLNLEEIKAVIAHELGHIYHKHHYQRFGFMSITSFILLYFCQLLFTQDWFYLGLHVEKIGGAAGLLLMIMILPIFAFPLQPLANFMAQRAELEADQYASEKVHSTALIHVFLKLGGDGSSYFLSDPWYNLVYETHPPLTERIALLRHRLKH